MGNRLVDWSERARKDDRASDQRAARQLALHCEVGAEPKDGGLHDQTQIARQHGERGVNIATALRRLDCVDMSGMPMPPQISGHPHAANCCDVRTCIAHEQIFTASEGLCGPRGGAARQFVEACNDQEHDCAADRHPAHNGVQKKNDAHIERQPRNI